MKRAMQLSLMAAAFALSQSAWSASPWSEMKMAMTVPTYPGDAEANFDLTPSVTFADLHRSDMGRQMSSAFPLSLVVMIDD
jgi:hypothetical protein